jgi:hypothetical protein
MLRPLGAALASAIKIPHSKTGVFAGLRFMLFAPSFRKTFLRFYFQHPMGIALNPSRKVANPHGKWLTLTESG